MSDGARDEVLAAARRLVAAADARQQERVVRAGSVTLDRASRWLRWPSGRKRLGPATAALAACLIEHPGELLPRAALLAAAGWYSDPSLTRRLDAAASRLRRVLPGELRAVAGYGYRWSPPR